MKRKTILIMLYTCLSVFFLVACSSKENNSEVTTDESKMTNDSNESSSNAIIDRDTSTIEEDSNKQEETTKKDKSTIKVFIQTSDDKLDDLIYRLEVHYNKEGNIEKELEIYYEEYTETKYIYNNKLLEKKEICYDENGNKKEIIEYFYDKNGNVIDEKISRIFNHGETMYYGSYKYVYDTNGNMIELIKTEGDSLVIIKYYYDDNKLIKTTVNGRDYENYEYDSKGYLISKKRLYSSQSFYREDKYVNDSKGNVIEVKQYEYELIDNLWSSKLNNWNQYEYNESKQLVKETEFSTYDGEIKNITEYKYDENGNYTKKSSWYSDSSNWHHTIYTNEYEYYDDNE